MSEVHKPQSVSCVCGEINTRHCPVHGQDSSPHSSANDGRTHWAECWRVHLDCAEVRIERLEEQYQAARELLVETHDLIWNEDAAMVAGGEKLLDALAEKIMANLDSNPAITLNDELKPDD